MKKLFKSLLLISLCLGLVACGGDVKEWIDGVNEMLTEAGILKDGTRLEDVTKFEHDGITNLLFKFGKDDKIDIGKFAMWRLQTHSQFGGTWLSDYVPNRLGGYINETTQDEEPVEGVEMSM